jgi:hypothetical protein
MQARESLGGNVEGAPKVSIEDVDPRTVFNENFRSTDTPLSSSHRPMEGGFAGIVLNVKRTVSHEEQSKNSAVTST